MEGSSGPRGRHLLGRGDWLYLLSLLLPFAVYDVASKALSVASRPGLAPAFDLVRSDVFFDLGYALLWIGLFAATRGRGLLRRIAVVSFHVATVLVVIVCTAAHQYLRETGTALDYDILVLWIPQFSEVWSVLTGSVPLSAWLLLGAALLYAAFGPWLVSCAVGWWRTPPGRRRQGRSEPAPTGGTGDPSLLGSLGLLLVAVGLVSLSLLVVPADGGKSIGRDPFVNIVLTGAEGDPEDALAVDGADLTTAENPAAEASLARTPNTEKRNVVLIHLESTRAGATTPYNPDLATTPFLDELAKDSLLAERSYTTVPHSSKATISVNCGIYPRLVQPTTEADPGGIPVPCLADLLKERGYGSALFQSTTKDFENFEGLADNLGYEDYYPLETMNTEGAAKTNYFGYEDDIMLEPSEDWLKQQGDGPFVAEYLLGTGHHDYRCLGTRHGQEAFSGDDLLNRYLNCIRLQDVFLENLIDQYKALGLYEETIFVVFGDHGEGFGEHGRFQHDDTIYEEGLKVPLLVHAPGLLGGGRAKGLSNHTDVLPTVLEMLGYEVEGGVYPGYSLLHPLPKDRTLTFSCFHESRCLASIRGSEKYVYHFGDQPDEVFDLSEDPLEKYNLANERGEEEINARRQDLLRWRSEVNATYTAADG